MDKNTYSSVRKRGDGSRKSVMPPGDVTTAATAPTIENEDALFCHNMPICNIYRAYHSGNQLFCQD